MAGTSASNGDTASAPITRLRTIAENHLKEIDEEKQLEQAADAKRMEELQRYAKRRLKGKAAESVLPTSTPTLKLRSAQGVSSARSRGLAYASMSFRCPEPPTMGSRV